MEEKVVNISHKLILDNRKEASVTGVKDVISFDEKEILLQTADGKLQIRGSGLHVKGLNLEKRAGKYASGYYIPGSLLPGICYWYFMGNLRYSDPDCGSCI